jgi:hypothetical protein
MFVIAVCSLSNNYLRKPATIRNLLSNFNQLTPKYMDVPSFFKHILTGKEKPKADKAEVKIPDKPAEKSFDDLKREALEVLNLKIKEAIKKAKDLQNKDFDAAEKALSEAERLVEQGERVKFGNPLIDDLEEILGSKKEGEHKFAGTISEIAEMAPEGVEIRFELKEQAKYWNKFYKNEGVDWAPPIPEDIKVTAEQAADMKRLIKEYGFNKIVIIPDNLVGEPEVEEYEEEKDGKTVIKKRLKKPAENYEKLHQLMSEGYPNKTYQGDNYKADGGLGGSQDRHHRHQGLRIILTKEIQNLADDELFNETLGKSVDDLSAEGGLFKEKGLGGLTESEYLILQREYFRKTGKHLDEKGWTWLPASRRPVSGRAPSGSWYGARLSFGSDTAEDHSASLGCRLAGNFFVK